MDSSEAGLFSVKTSANVGLDLAVDPFKAGGGEDPGMPLTGSSSWGEPGRPRGRQLLNKNWLAPRVALVWRWYF